jgi:Essential protein Yae1, N terminal
MESDPFDDLLSLEDKFYDEGFQLGTADGAKAGRIEGRVFGLEKGFEKYVENGRLHGRTLVWISRIHQNRTEATNGSEGNDDLNKDDVTPSFARKPSLSMNLLPYSTNPRLEKHLRVLYALTEPASLSTDNTEDAVSDFDDRFKRALGKVKIIERLLGEQGIPATASEGVSGSHRGQPSSSGGTDASIEDVNILKARH